MTSNETRYSYVQFPTYILDCLLNELSGTEFKILSLIIRNTIGWYKSFDSISLTQFMNKLSLSKPSVIKALKSLQSKKYIIIKRTNYITSYAISKKLLKRVKTEELVETSKNILPTSKEILPTGKKTLPTIDTSLLHTDSQSIKRKIKKDISLDLDDEIYSFELSKEDKPKVVYKNEDEKKDKERIFVRKLQKFISTEFPVGERAMINALPPQKYWKKLLDLVKIHGKEWLKEYAHWFVWEKWKRGAALQNWGTFVHFSFVDEFINLGVKKEKAQTVKKTTDKWHTPEGKKLIARERANLVAMARQLERQQS